jgi:hypothetical protein
MKIITEIEYEVRDLDPIYIIKLPRVFYRELGQQHITNLTNLCDFGRKINKLILTIYSEIQTSAGKLESDTGGRSSFSIHGLAYGSILNDPFSEAGGVTSIFWPILSNYLIGVN